MAEELLVVWAGGRLHGLRLAQVDEVIKPPPFAELPNTPPWLRGVTKVRGEVIPIFDLAGRLGLQVSRVEGPGERVVVARTARGRVGLRVSDTAGVWREAEVRGRQARQGERIADLVDLEALADWRAPMPRVASEAGPKDGAD
jgi:chemotaxis signal transduction protein